MLLTELPARLETEFTYPVEIDTVIERMGTTEVETPDRTDPETVSSILLPLGGDTFDSASMLYETIYGNVSDDHVGRKYYDDRGSNVTEDGDGPSDEVNVSF
jgi:hypothetical protein